MQKEHQISIFVNGKQLDLFTQEDLNLRFNAIMFQPEKIGSNQADYSFEFTVPTTPNNNKIFDYANNLGKLDKFRPRFKAEVFADGFRIFTGSLTLNSCEHNEYSLNLVKLKVYSLDEIFGDSTLNTIKKLYYDQSLNKNVLKDWEIPFEGPATINLINSATTPTEVTFPLVSYGVFQKVPIPEESDEIASVYSSKFDMDEYNRWYIESFYPSLRMLDVMKNAFNTKGYTVDGDVWQNAFLKQIYLSTNLADGQVPEYNLGNPSFGKVSMHIDWTNTPNPLLQDLNYPYFRVGGVFKANGQWSTDGMDTAYNFDTIQLYDILDEGTVTMQQEKSYMYQPDEHIIVIPADGWYKISLQANATLLTPSTATLTPYQYIISLLQNEISYIECPIHPDFKMTTPLEIQLVRNYDSNIELIKGYNNVLFLNGAPSDVTFDGIGNTNSFPTCFPHEKLGTAYFNPTEDNGLHARDKKHKSLVGYMPSDGEIMAYDPIVNDGFICGFTTMGNETGGGCASVIKNGKSWSNEYNGEIESFYNQSGYKDVDYVQKAEYHYVAMLKNYYKIRYYSGETTNYNKNTYINAPAHRFTQDATHAECNIDCLVKLNKNDVLQLYGIHRDYRTEDGASLKYYTSASIDLTIEALSSKRKDEIISLGYGYDTPTDFPYNLRLSNFLNSDTKISEWIQNVINAYNLEIYQEGNNVTINTKKPFDANLPIAVDIDDRTNTVNAKSERINYPRTMSVRYKIDDDEWGAENSVVEKYGAAKMNDENWKDFIDRGYDIIELDNDTYVTQDATQNVNFAYTWYDQFNWFEVDDAHIKQSDTAVTLNMPVISKFQYMVDGYDYEESAKHDGYGLTQRFWFKPVSSTAYVYTETYPKERVDIYLPVNNMNINDEVLNLSYKATEPSLLQKYFNIKPYLESNYVYINVYLTPEEYFRIKGGCLVRFGSDCYWPVEIQGYDVTDNNETTLKLMKKVN